ncbi:hypothetical protein CDAR_169051 [Caerostris darwini]|uniref:Uncharacterized protein n=1 Tax=Caerostris darwini TaxID=1538125 RepID=A0AAV4WSR1_9ARAC|nr:hypothetical protein CDAR_169051 [Caerostris darwini]
MGNKVGTIQHPVAMTKSLLEQKIVHDLAVVEGLDASELLRHVKIDGIESNFVLSLNLENKGLLNIAYLWKFNFLAKLDLANNFIEEIEGIETLSKLQYLDLLFNSICKSCLPGLK